MSSTRASVPRSLRWRQILLAPIRWFDNRAFGAQHESPAERSIDWMRTIPFAAVHVVALLGPLFVGWSWFAVGVAVALYWTRMFAVTGFYHRYFSHRTFRTSRPTQFLLALAGSSAAQKGPLWWAAHHREHHVHSDEPGDIHSPHQDGVWWSHVGWITSRENFPTKIDRVPDLAKYPELRFLDRFDVLVPFLLGAGLFGLGEGLERWAPGLATTGPQLLIWGFFISTVVLFHCTCLINSAAHLFGRRRYDTDDHSRNSMILALITMGEGWHNNHHHCQRTVRQGFYWWEIDMTFYLLKVMSWCGLIWDLKPVPEHVREKGLARAV